MKSFNADKIKDEFTKQAKHFETHKANFKCENYLEYMVNELAPEKSDNVLEVAAGTCICGRTLAPFVNSVTCVDLTPAMLKVGKEQAEKENIKNISFVLGDANELPFLDDSFDIVISRLAFHHFADAEKAFSQMARVLKKGGKFVYIDMLSPDDEFRNIQNEIEIMRDPSHIKNLSKSEVFKLFDDNNIKILKSNITKMKKNLVDWLDFTNTPNETRQKIINLFTKELNGKGKTGFYPFTDNGSICFNHNWLMVIGEKNYNVA